MYVYIYIYIYGVIFRPDRGIWGPGSAAGGAIRPNGYYDFTNIISYSYIDKLHIINVSISYSFIDSTSLYHILIYSITLYLIVYYLIF